VSSLESLSRRSLLDGSSWESVERRLVTELGWTSVGVCSVMASRDRLRPMAGVALGWAVRSVSVSGRGCGRWPACDCWELALALTLAVASFDAKELYW